MGFKLSIRKMITGQNYKLTNLGGYMIFIMSFGEGKLNMLNVSKKC